jgi:hypothetical protein
VRKKSRDAAEPSRAPIASSGEVLHGRAFRGASSAARPAAERDAGAISGFRTCMTMRASPMVVPW